MTRRRPNAAYGILLIVLASVGQWVSPVENARILAVEGFAAKSHWYFMSAVLRSLTDAGHEVTVFTPFPEGDRENYTEVDVSQSLPAKIGLDIVKTMETIGRPFTLFDAIVPLIRGLYCDVLYKNDRFENMLRNSGDYDYDVIVVELLAFDCMSHLAAVMKLPIVHLIPSPMITFVERTVTGHYSNPACVTNMLGYQAVPKTFVQRLVNTVLFVYGSFVTTYHGFKLKTFDPKLYDQSPTVVPSIVFQNSHYITEVARPVMPNLIEIGGIHLSAASEDIPKVSYIYVLMRQEDYHC